MTQFLYFSVAAALSWLLCWPVYCFLRRLNIVDRPNERSSHSRPTVRGGGIAILLVIVLGSALSCIKTSHYLLLVIPLLAFGMGVVSFLDDIRPVSPTVRFSCHAFTAVFSLGVLLFPLRGQMFSSAPTALLSFGLAAVLFIWITGYTNAFNFMDGINGLAGTQAFLTGVGMALLVIHQTRQFDASIQTALIVSGTGLGFLPYNFPRARMFMGDVSSAPLGFLLSFLVVWLAAKHGWELLFPLALMHTNFVLDTGITLLRRILRGEKWHQPHREHFYQRLVRAKKSHAFVTLTEAGLQVTTFALLFLYITNGLLVKFATSAAVLLVWLGFFYYAERLFRKTQRHPEVDVSNSRMPLSVQ